MRTNLPAVPVEPQPGCAGPDDAWLLPRLELRFRPVSTPIDGPVPKLGGQPGWLAAPTWPRSRALGTPMMFVGQFPVPGDPPRLAYLFLTDEDGAATFEPEAGENAVLLQPGGVVPPFVTVDRSDTGPSLWRRGANWADRIPVELAVDLTPLDPAVESVLDAEIEYGAAERDGGLPGAPEPAESGVLPPYSYLGGRARLWQPRFPALGPPWRFLCQLDGAEGIDDQPYALNLGGGTGYAFVTPDRTEGRFYWDCP